MKTNNNKNTRTKPVTRTLQFVVTGKDQNGNDYDADSAKAIVAELQESGTFDKLSVMATASRALITNKEDARGVMNIARVQSYNNETESIDLLFFGKNVENADKVENLVIVPRVRTERDSDKVCTILAFEIVNPMEA